MSVENIGKAGRCRTSSRSAAAPAHYIEFSCRTLNSKMNNIFNKMAAHCHSGLEPESRTLKLDSRLRAKETLMR